MRMVIATLVLLAAPLAADACPKAGLFKKRVAVYLIPQPPKVMPPGKIVNPPVVAYSVAPVRKAFLALGTMGVCPNGKCPK